MISAMEINSGLKIAIFNFFLDQYPDLIGNNTDKYSEKYRVL